MEHIIDLSVAELAKRLTLRDLSAVEACEAYLAAIEAQDGVLRAYITLDAEAARSRAAEIDRRRWLGEELPALAGVPMAVKDNMCTKGLKTTCASNMLRDFVPPYSAFAVNKLHGAGAVLLGKTNMDEFAMGSTGETSAFGAARNPLDTGRVAGGSSSGSAVAVAAKEAAFALGTDTGGSIRQPSAFCGVVGMKPTYGGVSRNGVVAFASSLDQVGPIARSVEDVAMVLSAICGHDPGDSTSVDRPHPDYTAGLEEGVQGMRIGMPREFLGEGIAPDVQQAVLAAARQFEALGAHVEEISVPVLASALPSYYVISSAEASSNLARFDGVHYGYRAGRFETMEELYKNSRTEGFGAEVKRRILLGTFVLSAGYYDAYYLKALQVRRLIMDGFARAFENYDVVMTPTAPTVAYRFGEKSEPMQMYMGDICTVPVNIAGLPALSMPCGAGEGGLPVGLQLIGKAFGEADILRAARAYEQSREVG